MHVPEQRAFIANVAQCSVEPQLVPDHAAAKIAREIVVVLNGVAHIQPLGTQLVVEVVALEAAGLGLQVVAATEVIAAGLRDEVDDNTGQGGLGQRTSIGDLQFAC